MKALIAAALFAASPALADDIAGMAKAAEGFYTVHQSSNQDGLPDAALKARYAPYLSPALSALLSEAQAVQDRFAAKIKNAPPIFEGDVFSPNADGITSFRVGTCAADGQGGHCAVAMHYAVKPQDKPIDWTDTIYLVSAGGSWRVNDIAFGAIRDPGNPGRLSDELKSAISDTNG